MSVLRASAPALMNVLPPALSTVYAAWIPVKPTARYAATPLSRYENLDRKTAHDRAYPKQLSRAPTPPHGGIYSQHPPQGGARVALQLLFRDTWT